MHREPKTVRRCLGDAMADVGGDVKVVARIQGEGWLILNLQDSLAAHDHDPFVMRLIVPESDGAGLGVGGDALDLHPACFQESVEGFLRGMGVEIGKQGLRFKHDHA